MFLEINTPEGSIFREEIEKVLIPTEIGEICILKNHQNLISIVRPGLVKIKLHNQKKEEFLQDTQFLFEDDRFVVSVGSGTVYVDGEIVVVLVSKANHNIETDIEALEKVKIEMEKEIIDIKVKGSIDEIEKAYLNIQKISADIKLYKIRHKL